MSSVVLTLHKLLPDTDNVWQTSGTRTLDFLLSKARGYETTLSAVQKPVPEPIFAITPGKNNTGTDDLYLPKGAWQNPDKRNWKKFQRWAPPGGLAD